MDLLITSGYTSIKLSDKGIITTDFDESSPSITTNSKTFAGRNGKLHFGSDYGEKKLSYSGILKTYGLDDYEEKKNWLYSVLASKEPYYVQMIYSDNGLYEYEVPGAGRGNVYSPPNGFKSNKRFKVLLDETLQSEFIGRVGYDLIFKISAKFVTAELPFGESEPMTKTVTDSIPYLGTTTVSQLEVPFYIQLTASEAANGISLKVGNNTWTYTGDVAVGDVFQLGGMYNMKNHISINDDTNLEYFALEPSYGGVVPLSSSIDAIIEIHDYKELYL